MLYGHGDDSGRVIKQMESQSGNKPSRKEREWLQRRKLILEAAAGLFAEFGYSGTTMQHIADRADFSVGYLYRHFAAKITIVEALIDRELDHYDRIVAENADSGLSTLQTYRRILEKLCSHLTTRRDLVRVMSRDSLLRRLPDRNTRLQKFSAIDQELMRQAWAAGEIPLVDFELLSAVISGVFDNLMMEFAEDEDPAAFERIPGIVFEFVLDPLIRRIDGESPRKEDTDARHHSTEA